MKVDLSQHCSYCKNEALGIGVDEAKALESTSASAALLARTFYVFQLQTCQSIGKEEGAAAAEATTTTTTTTTRWPASVKSYYSFFFLRFVVIVFCWHGCRSPGVLLGRG